MYSLIDLFTNYSHLFYVFNPSNYAMLIIMMTDYTNCHHFWWPNCLTYI